MPIRSTIFCCYAVRLQLGASLDQCLALFIAGVLGKVLDEASSQILCLGQHRLERHRQAYLH